MSLSDPPEQRAAWDRGYRHGLDEMEARYSEEIARLTAENAHLRSVLPPGADRAEGGVGEGTWSVYAQKVVAERDALAAALAKVKEAVCVNGFRKPLDPGDEGCEACGNFYESRSEDESHGVCDLCAQTILQDVESALALDPLCAAALARHAAEQAVIQAARDMVSREQRKQTAALPLYIALDALDAVAASHPPDHEPDPTGG